MNPSDEATQIVPEILRLKELIEEIPGGSLRVPRFQRPYVWQPKDMLDLFDSIYRGYPVGSILLWETEHPLESLGQIGPLSFGPDTRRPRRMVLDGHQRLATLAGCLLAPSASNQIGEGPWSVYYDLLRERFVHHSKGSVPDQYFPLRALLRTVDFIRESRRLERIHGPQRSEVLVDRAEQLADRFATYKISVVTIRGGDLGQAVEIFSRLNNKGRDITPDAMISALTFVDSQQSVAESVDLLHEATLNAGFGPIRRAVLLQILVASLDIDPRISKAEELANRLKREQKDLGSAQQQAEESLLKSIEFLFSKVGVAHSRLLPYAPQMLMLCEYFRFQIGPSQKHLEGLVKWFWHTSLSGWFAGANDSLLVDALVRMRDFARDPVGEYEKINPGRDARPLPRKFDARSARIKAFLAFWFKHCQPLCLDGSAPIAAVELLNQSSLPYVFRGQEVPRSLQSSPANRAFIFYSQRSQFLNMLDHPGSFLESDVRVLASHGFDALALEMIHRDPEEAVNRRFDCFETREMEYMQSLGIPFVGEDPKFDWEAIDFGPEELSVDDIPF